MKYSHKQVIVKTVMMTLSCPCCNECECRKKALQGSNLFIRTQSSDFNVEADLNVTSSVSVVMDVSGFPLWEEMAAGT